VTLLLELKNILTSFWEAISLSLAKDTGFYSIANWGRRFVGLATAPVLIAYFSPAEYGYMSLVQTLASLCSILGLLAIVDQGLPRFFIDSEEEGEKKGYFSTAAFASCLGVLGVSCLTLGFTPLVGIFIDDVASPIVFTALIAVLCLGQSVYYAGSNMLKWTFQSPLFMKITLCQAIIGGGLTIFLVVVFGAKAKCVLVVMALVALGAGIVANWGVRGYFRFAAISRQKFGQLVTYSWPLLGLNIFAFFTRSLDRIFLASLTSLTSVGIFSVSYMIASVFETLISGFFLPGVRTCFRHFAKAGHLKSMHNTLARFPVLGY
jgi:O-antigen/teichoic acid export membrane protein